MRKLILILIGFLLLPICFAISPTQDTNTGTSYQTYAIKWGTLCPDGSSVTYEMYDANTGGNLISTQTFTNSVSNGISADDINTTSLTMGKVYWLQRKCATTIIPFSNGANRIRYDTVIGRNGSILKESSCIVDINGAGDYTDIQSCINKACPNGEVFIKKGIYTIIDYLKVPSNCSLLGEGASTIIQGTNILLMNLNISTGNINIEISNLYFIGDTSGAGNGIYLINVSNSYIHNIWIKGTSQHGLELHDSYNNVINSVISFNNKLDGIVITDNSYGNILSNIISYNNSAYGIGIIQVLSTNKNPLDNKIVDSTLFNNNYGINTKGDLHTQIIGNTIFNNTNDGIHLGTAADNPTNYSVVVGNTVKNNDAINAGYVGIYVHGCNNLINGNDISDDRIIKIQDYGVQLNKDCYNIVSNNYIGTQQKDAILTGYNVTNQYFMNEGYNYNSLTSGFNKIGIGTVPGSESLGIVAGGNILFGTASGLASKLLWGGTTQTTAPSIYSNGNYLVLNSYSSNPLYFNFDNSDSGSSINMYNGQLIIKPSISNIATQALVFRNASSNIKAVFDINTAGETSLTIYNRTNGGNILLAGGGGSSILSDSIASEALTLYTIGDTGDNGELQLKLNNKNDNTGAWRIGDDSTKKLLITRDEGAGYGTVRFMIDDVTGNIGIGTNIPKTSLQIQDSNAYQLIVNSSGTVSGIMFGLNSSVQLQRKNAGSNLTVYLNPSTGSKYFEVSNNNPVFTVSDTGEVKANGVSNDGTNKVVCIKSDTTFGTCDAGLTCTCA